VYSGVMRSLVVLVPLLASCAVDGADPTPAPQLDIAAQPVGLSLWFQNGTMTPTTIYGDVPRYMQEIDVVDSVTTTDDEGATPALGLLPGVDWTGLHFIEEDWRAPGDGTWTRQRFYRGAAWMIEPSVFAALPVDNLGLPVGAPILFDAGTDQHWNKLLDDGFVRRFEVRQIVLGCQAQGDCSNATAFQVQAFAAVRQEQHPTFVAQSIPERATGIRLLWTAEHATRTAPPNRTVAITHAESTGITYGFQPTIALAAPPANGSYFLPGDTISVRVAFLDGAGNRLNPVGSLPTYAQTLAGQANGLHYWNPTLNATLYYAYKHRESNMILQLAGPTNALAIPTQTTQLGEFFAPQVTIASVATDGYTAAAVEIPFLPSVLGGYEGDPTQWDLPISDVQTLQIAPDALPGTYVLAIKGRREWGGEALDRGTTISIQVGQAAPTTFTPTTGNCENCHNDRSSLAIVNHGLDDHRACFGCHPSLSFEPDNALDIRVHSIHSRSQRFPAQFTNCATCHLTPPNGPARGALLTNPDE
jgi:hypothetical protein